MPELLLGVDVGTSSAKAVVLDSGGRVLGEGQTAYNLATPQPNWAEQEAGAWWSGLVEAVRKALEVSRIQEGEVAALGVSALYGGSGVPVDAGFRPLAPALIWMDRRAEEESAWALKEIGLERLFAITGNGADPYYGFTKLLWIRRHWPEVWAKAGYFLPPGSFLVHRLTGEVVVDHVTAGNLGGIYDLRKRAWSESLAEALGIPLERLPERLIAPTEPAGRLREEAARTLGLPSGIPVFSAGIDAAVATLSAGAVGPGPHVAMLGTSMCWGFVSPELPKTPALVSMPYVLEPERLVYTFGGAATAGAAVAWFRGVFGEEVDLATLEQEAAGAPPGSAGLVFLPYLMGERSPIWDPKARGVFAGLSLVHTRGHLYRAVLEGLAYALRHNLEVARQAGYRVEGEMRAVGGGARSPLWMQILADATGYPVRAVPEGGEAAFGSAMVTALGLGWARAEDLPAWLSGLEQKVFLPQNGGPYREGYARYLELYGQLQTWFARGQAQGS